MRRILPSRSLFMSAFPLLACLTLAGTAVAQGPGGELQPCTIFDPRPECIPGGGIVILVDTGRALPGALSKSAGDLVHFYRCDIEQVPAQWYRSQGDIVTSDPGQQVFLGCAPKTCTVTVLSCPTAEYIRDNPPSLADCQEPESLSSAQGLRIASVSKSTTKGTVNVKLDMYYTLQGFNSAVSAKVQIFKDTVETKPATNFSNLASTLCTRFQRKSVTWNALPTGTYEVVATIRGARVGLQPETTSPASFGLGESENYTLTVNAAAISAILTPKNYPPPPPP